jgi:arylsulfatase A-like enzyme
MTSRLKLALSIYGFWLAVFLIARVGFLAHHHAAAGQLSLGAIAEVFLAGARLDLSAAAYLTLVPVVLLGLSVFEPLLVPARALLWLWMVAAIVVVVLLATIDAELARHWHRRVDASILPYLGTPREALASAGGSPRLLLLGTMILTIAAAVLVARRFVLVPLNRLGSQSWGVAVGCWALIVPLFVAGRGGVQTWPLTISSAYHSTEPFANLAAQNAVWGFFDSIYRRLYDRSNPFVEMPDPEARATIAAAKQPSGPRQPAPLSVSNPNIILVIWESASARAFESLGGSPAITPRFDGLVKDGILFRSFYSAADRTDKAVAAVLSGSPAIPRGSIVTVPSKAASLPSLSRDLKEFGYRTAFYYGGELEFASLQAYLTSAGFDRVMGKNDFSTRESRSKWGAHDGPVAARLLDDLDRMPEPFFVVWLTLSSHEPFDVPDGRAQRGDWQTRYFQSMSYTDSVIGQLVTTASAKPWWSRALFVITADHGRRFPDDYGRRFPTDTDRPPRLAETEYRVPMLWLGGALAVRDSVVTGVGSQLDLAPTLLDLVGVRSEGQFGFGRSLLVPVLRPAAYYGFDTGYGVVTDHGALLYDHDAKRVISTVGRVGDWEKRLGAAMLQLSYQDYLDR